MTPFPSRALAGALLCAAAASAWSANRLAPDVIARFGGDYSTECGNPSAPRLQVRTDTLTVESRGQRLSGYTPDSAYSYFGNNPAPGFAVALLSQARGAGSAELTFLVSRDRGGAYIEVDGPPALRSLLGPAARRKFRHCEAATAGASVPMPVPGAMPTPQPPQRPPLPPGDPAGLTASAQFKRSWRSALGSLGREAWLADMNGPAIPPRWVEAAGDRYVLNAFCKPHDCYDNSAAQLYEPRSRQFYAFVHRGRQDGFVGNPPAPVARELQRLWNQEWRQQAK
jgi:hypothetical protein